MPTPVWKPGQSGNPKGRVPGAMTLAQAMRYRFPVEQIVAHAARLVEHAADERVQLAALQFIADRAYGKALTTAEITVRSGGDERAPMNWSTIEVDRRRALMEALAEVEARAADAGDAHDLADLAEGAIDVGDSLQ